jgi:hypothetical protein
MANTVSYTPKFRHGLPEIHRQQTGEELTDAEAWAMATNLLELGRLVLGETEQLPPRPPKFSIASIKKRVAECLSCHKFVEINFDPAKPVGGSIVIGVSAEDTSTRRGPKGTCEHAEKCVGERLAKTNWTIQNIKCNLGLLTFELHSVDNNNPAGEAGLS